MWLRGCSVAGVWYWLWKKYREIVEIWCTLVEDGEEDGVKGSVVGGGSGGGGYGVCFLEGG